MATPMVQARSLDLASVLDSDATAIGFSKTGIRRIYLSRCNIFWSVKIEAHFDLVLADELNSFSATGKPGEINEIPVSAQLARKLRTFDFGGAWQSISLRSSYRWWRPLAGKFGGKSISLFSIAATSRVELRTHSIALILGS